MRLQQENNKLIIAEGLSEVWIEPWGMNGLRVRMTKEAVMDTKDWALTEKVEDCKATIVFNEIDVTDPWYKGDAYKAYHMKATEASITNGKITAKVSHEGWISYYNQKGELLTAEYWRNRNRLNRYCVPLRIDARELKPIAGSSDYTLMARFEAFDDEKIFGMGQYQERQLNKKGALLELAHRNSQASVPFMISSRGYGLLWNNPAIGTAHFGTNKTEWYAQRTKKLDYYITAGDTPSEIEEQYSAVTGRTPMMPEYGLGYWQCKLRYRNQEELLSVAREHKRRGLPMDAIVVDFFHWTRQGDFKFEPRDWPDPEAMVKELKEMGIETVVSVWPTIDEKSENFAEMADRGYLVHADRGNENHMTWMGNTIFYDATHPGAQQFVWERCKEHYYNKGIRCFWLDEAEPEYGPYDFDNYRYYEGPALMCTNIYPAMYAKGFYDGLKAEGETEILSLVRCAWAGSQKYGVLTWSGDIYSSFRAMREQLQAGLNMGIAGIPWWTSDIGGFLGGDIKDKAFQELLVRWFAWGAFCPVFRMHGERSPWYEREEEFINGVRQLTSGQDNEVWSFGEDNYEILKQFLFIREHLRPYIRACMKTASDKGEPVMRPMFFDFPKDTKCWEVEDQYMFGPDLLVAPVMEAGMKERQVYLPEGTKWVDAYTKQTYEGGQVITTPTPLEVIPVMMREGKNYSIYEV
ncbi:glycoside hydrolase family 31 protein [Cellulosilyticum lentocellum]|uniref:Glycoside hydrolase family 31 n=1 Tax=Cellulosilyticum lentocellum (strain ATCC 49066 / DSM 5427 / NCIMB 11756 / RHM5) TaxID=642492 RepID=F2JJ84_CELLD|nr:glycoside hydrolase family 31 protein [Cellulosilyticum lentocellum]ADZ84377.1 glycoside hydrolase family 31 [Cellulosilyticum lentocellum DSM 5427]